MISAVIKITAGGRVDVYALRLSVIREYFLRS